MTTTLTPITPQQAFDAALFGIRKQQYRKSLYANPAHNGDMQCAYRGVNGDKCAFGHTLPDELYEFGLEGLPGDAVLLRNNGLRDFYSRCDGQMLTGMQWAHDNGLRDFYSRCDGHMLTGMQGAHDNGLKEGNFEAGPERSKRFEREMAHIATTYNLHYTPVPA